MRLLSLELKNIRSYRSTRIEFPTGITLLSGDIGAGKSTLLIAVEFAFFGLSRGELVGAALLRHGAATAEVRLEFEVQGKQYAITRALKRTPNGVVQDAGWLEHDGSRELLTPSELRARMYELLHYPLQFLAKQRNLLYRFTIYTPQEEMKSILSQSSEERLETIRRIFGIDAYRTARDNAHLLGKALKEQEAIAEGQLPRIAQEQERLALKLQREQELAGQRTRLHAEQHGINTRIQEQEGTMAKLDAERQAIQQEQQLVAMQERNRKIADAELQQLQLQLQRKERTLAEAKEQAAKLQKALQLFQQELHDVQLEQLQAEHATATQEIERLKQEEGKALALLEHNHAPSIAAGAACPTCKQVVSAAHLEELKATLHAQAEAAKRKQQHVQQRVMQQRQLVQQLQTKLDKQRQVDDVTRQLQLQERVVLQYTEEQKALAAMVQAKQQALPQLPAKDAALQERLRKAEQRVLEMRSTLQRHRQQLLEIEKALGRIEQEQQELAEARARLAQLAEERKLLEERMIRDSQLRSWVAKQFSPFTATVERHVLLSIHSTFDAVFRQWFSRLIEDDALSTRIDHEFAPVMVQHGYETDVAFLSGGERTAVSLAYRLALVHSIHILLPHLSTAGLIMLDEPTDGFSAEQLERVRDVLRDLRMEQIILVSHEQQLEGFVDHIIRVRKTGDGSVIEVAA